MITNFIPTIWSAMLLRELRKALVFGGVCNRNYEGDIKEKGDRVKITGLVPPTVRTYVRGTALAAPEMIGDDTRTLIVDQEKYINAAFDDLDLVQAAGKGIMAYAKDQASFAFADVIDQFIAAKYADADAGNILAVAQVTAANVYDMLENLSVKLSENNVPTSNRWIVVPPWVASLIRKSDLFTHATALGDQVVRNGIIGQAAGFTIHESNNVATAVVSTVTNWKVMAGHSMAITMAEQVNKMEAFRHPDYFSDNLKGLVNYGAKVVFPKALAVAQVTK